MSVYVTDELEAFLVKANALSRKYSVTMQTVIEAARVAGTGPLSEPAAVRTAPGPSQAAGTPGGAEGNAEEIVAASIAGYANAFIADETRNRAR